MKIFGTFQKIFDESILKSSYFPNSGILARGLSLVCNTSSNNKRDIWCLIIDINNTCDTVIPTEVSQLSVPLYN